MKILLDECVTKRLKKHLNNAKGYGHNNFKLKLAPNTIVEALKIVSAI